MELTVAGAPFATEEAESIIAGYAFKCEPAEFNPPKPAYGPAPQLPSRPRWAYRMYDCLPAAPGQDLTPHDVLLISGINGELNHERVTSALAVLPFVNVALRKISPDITFWDVDRKHIFPAGEPAEGTDGWWMHRAWWLLMGTPGLGPTITHKILHHKRPELFPLLDGATLERLKSVGQGGWLQIHDDLSAAPEAWSHLESWFEAHAVDPGDVPLTRLRLHDILLWTWVTPEQRDTTKNAGDRFLAGFESGQEAHGSR